MVLLRTGFFSKHGNMTYIPFEVLEGKFYPHNRPSLVNKNHMNVTLAISKGTLTQLVIAAANMLPGILLKKFDSTIQF